MNNNLISMILRSLLLISGLTAAAVLFLLVWNYLHPFLSAYICAALLRPFVLLLSQRLHLPHVLSILLVLSIFTLLALSTFALVLAELVKGFQHYSTDLPAQAAALSTFLMNQIREWGEPLFLRLQASLEHSGIMTSSIDEYLQAAQTQAGQISMDLLKGVFEAVQHLAGMLPTSAAYIGIVVIGTFFFSKDWETIHRPLHSVIPPIIQERALQLRAEMERTFKGLIRAQCKLVSISTFIIGTGLYLLDAPHLLAITAAACLLDFIPYVGTGVIFIPWMLFQFFSGDFPMTIGLAVLYAIVVLTRQMLEPKLMADQFGVPPIILLLTFAGGFKLLGVYGIMLSPILLMVIQTLKKTGALKELLHFITSK
nr:sporulation integral membrane protein YtvI [Halobacillus litoralis]